MNSIDRILLENTAWAAERQNSDPDIFKRLSVGQSPKVLWIGCSDSRVPAESICNAAPGEIFVFRNIANLISPQGDAEAVLEYAIKVLKVEHIIICGHHHCGGVKTALAPAPSGLSKIDAHLTPVRTLRDEHQHELEVLDAEAQVVRLGELNVESQVDWLAQHPLVIDALDEGQPLTLHGMMYTLETGHLRELVRWPDDPSLNAHLRLAVGQD